jgi:flavodoxin
MKDILVVYFSRSGYTRRVAEQVAKRAGADCEAIREHRSRHGLLGYWRSAHQALRAAAIDIEPGSLEPRKYALVVLGTPVWAGNVSAPMRAYIAKHRDDFTRVALFCTQGGSGAPKVLQKMTALCDQVPAATAFFNDAQIDAGSHLGKLDAFVAALAARAAA